MDEDRGVGAEAGPLGDPAAPGADPEEEAFGEDGRWRSPPRAWQADPSDALHSRHFWEALHRCLADLPARQASAFSLREFEGLETPVLCKEVDVTPTNLWAILHRARLALRRCLEASGFLRGGTGGNAMIYCRDATRLASKALDTSLTLRERVGLRIHLMMCDGCKRYREQLSHLRDLIRAGLRHLEALEDGGAGLTADEAAAMVRALRAAETEG